MEKKRTKVLISHYGFEQDQLAYKIQDRRFIARFGRDVEQLAQRWLQNPENPDPELDRVLRNKIWRPSVALAASNDPKFKFDEYYLLYNVAKNQKKDRIEKLKHEIDIIVKDIKEVSGITVTTVPLEFESISDPWEISKVFPKLCEQFKDDKFHNKDSDYYVFCNNGTLQIRISLFLITHQQLITAMRINAMPWKNTRQRDLATEKGDACCSASGTLEIEDPEKVRSDIYDNLALGKVSTRRDEIQTGIQTKNKAYQTKLRLIKEVAKKTRDPILLTGPTGSGKTQIAQNIAMMRKKLSGEDTPFKKFNCAAFGGDLGIARSQLFGHSANAFTDAGAAQDGLLKQADGGILFLDEIGELPLGVQAMLLTALESGDTGKKTFQRMGDGKEIESDFMLICGTNHDLWEDVDNKTFRRDLLERISLWHFDLPSLSERKEDIPANCQFALEKSKIHVRAPFSDMTFAPDAEKKFIEFCQDDKKKWVGNLREFNAMVWRMATLAQDSLITVKDVDKEIKRWERMQKAEHKTGNPWNDAATTTAQAESSTTQEPVVAQVQSPVQTSPLPDASCDFEFLRGLLNDKKFKSMRLDELAQLAFVVSVCKESKNQAEASRRLRSNQGEKNNGGPQLLRYFRGLGIDFDTVKKFAQDLVRK